MKNLGVVHDISQEALDILTRGSADEVRNLPPRRLGGSDINLISRMRAVVKRALDAAVKELDAEIKERAEENRVLDAKIKECDKEKRALDEELQRESERMEHARQKGFFGISRGKWVSAMRLCVSMVLAPFKRIFQWVLSKISWLFGW
jgi:hypothetical protein